MNIKLFKEFNSMLFTILKKELVIYIYIYMQERIWFNNGYLNGSIQISLPNVKSYSFTRYSMN